MLFDPPNRAAQISKVITPLKNNGKTPKGEPKTRLDRKKRSR